VRTLFPDVMEEDRRAPRAAGTVPATVAATPPDATLLDPLGPTAHAKPMGRLPRDEITQPIEAVERARPTPMLPPGAEQAPRRTWLLAGGVLSVLAVLGFGIGFLAIQMTLRWGKALDVLEAPDPASALAIAAERTPDAIVIDVHFPGETIHGSVAALRQLAPHAPIIAYSGAASHREAHALGRLGVDDYLEKAGSANVALILDIIEHWDPARRSIVLCAEDGVDALREAHEEFVRAALRSTGDNRKAAARKLGVPVRLLYYYIQKYGIEG
jgi:CheY-like chemotaxis protein